MFDVIELPYNVFNRSLGEDGALDLLAYAHEKDIGLINMKAFNGNGMVPIYQVIREYIPIDYPAMLRFCFVESIISPPSMPAYATRPSLMSDFQTAMGKTADRQMSVHSAQNRSRQNRRPDEKCLS